MTVQHMCIRRIPGNPMFSQGHISGWYVLILYSRRSGGCVCIYLDTHTNWAIHLACLLLFQLWWFWWSIPYTATKISSSIILLHNSAEVWPARIRRLKIEELSVPTGSRKSDAPSPDLCFSSLWEHLFDPSSKHICICYFYCIVL